MYIYKVTRSQKITLTPSLSVYSVVDTYYMELIPSASAGVNDFWLSKFYYNNKFYSSRFTYLLIRHLIQNNKSTNHS